MCTLLQAVSAVNGTLFKGNKYAYIIADYELDDRNPLENEYTRIVMTIRDIFKNSVPYSSDRWYSESQSLDLAYIPVISGKHFPVAFSIPFYKLFDSDESSIAKTMFPCDIEVELSEKMVTSETKNLWINSMRKLEELKIYIKRYQQVLQAPINESYA